MFKDRVDAGQKLAKALINYQNDQPIVLAIPRGGIVVAYYVAKYLHGQLSILVARKLGFPSQPEAAFGAIAEDGSTYFSPGVKSYLTKHQINDIIQKEQQELKRRINYLRKGKPLPDMNNRNVILVDDGIATGSTLLASIKMCENRNAGKIAVAAPVSSTKTAEELEKWVDDLIILERIKNYYAVSQAYEKFTNESDETVLTYLEQWEQETSDLFTSEAG